MQQARKPKPKWALPLLAFAAGILLVAGTGATVTATDQAKFCASCHAMSEAVWTHKQSVHAKFACNECHTPATLSAKLPYKAKVGLHDIYVNTLSNVPDLIHAQSDMKNVVQANCRRCHTVTTMNVAMDSKPFCVDCHRSVPHNNKTPIDKRRAADV